MAHRWGPTLLRGWRWELSQLSPSGLWQKFIPAVNFLSWVMMVVWWLQSGPFYCLCYDNFFPSQSWIKISIDSVRVSWYWPPAFSILLEGDLHWSEIYCLYTGAGMVAARPLKGRDQSVGRMLLNVSLKQNMSTSVDLWSEASTDRNQKRHCNEDMMGW